MLVLLDIDNTLMEPVQEIGSDQWFCSRIKLYEAQNYTPKEALKKALREWQAVQYITDVKVIEPGIQEQILRLQQRGQPLMGFTTRGIEMSVRAIEQLESIDIDLKKTAPTKEEIYFYNERGALYTSGVLFTTNTHKGEALKKFLAAINYHPKAILFINDKKSHLQPVEEFCQERGIKFIGLHYGYTDEKVNNLRNHIAEVQWQFFGHILSDEAAEKILREF